MTISEAINNVKKDGDWTTENMTVLKDAVDNTDFNSFEDPKLKEFIDYINEAPYNPEIQSIVTSIAVRLMEKGVLTPCGSSGCGSCALHSMEFDNV